MQTASLSFHFFDTPNPPHPRDPFHTVRGEKSRASAQALLGYDRVAASVQILRRDGFFGVSKGGNAGVFEHNVLTHAAARLYAKYGLRVVDSHALKSNGEPTARDKLTVKSPRGAGWTEEATTDPDKIDARWTGDGEYPPNNKGEVYPYPPQARSALMASSKNLEMSRP